MENEKGKDGKGDRGKGSEDRVKRVRGESG